MWHLLLSRLLLRRSSSSAPSTLHHHHLRLLCALSSGPSPISSDADLRKYAGYALVLLGCGAATYYSFPSPADALHKKVVPFKYVPLPEDLHTVSNWRHFIRVAKIAIAGSQICRSKGMASALGSPFGESGVESINFPHARSFPPRVPTSRYPKARACLFPFKNCLIHDFEASLVYRKRCCKKNFLPSVVLFPFYS
jgi:hypothetical protein